MQEVGALPETRLLKRSSLYRTAPVGFVDQPDFINAVVASVDAAGRVVALAPGSAVLIATARGGAGRRRWSSLPSRWLPSDLASATSVIVGQTVQATATVRDAAGNVLTGRTVTWSSSNSAVATVSGSGLVTTIATGAVSLTASCEGRSGSATLAVTPIPVATVSVVLSREHLRGGDQARHRDLARCERQRPHRAHRHVVVEQHGGGDRDGSGLVTARGAGSASIRATSEGRTGSATLVSALVPVATVSVSLTRPPSRPG